MAVQRLSLALSKDTYERALASAQRQGLSLSAWLDRAAASALCIEDGLVAVAEWEADNGSLTAEELAAADAILDVALLP